MFENLENVQARIVWNFQHYKLATSRLYAVKEQIFDIYTLDAQILHTTCMPRRYIKMGSHVWCHNMGSLSSLRIKDVLILAPDDVTLCCCGLEIVLLKPVKVRESELGGGIIVFQFSFIGE